MYIVSYFIFFPFIEDQIDYLYKRYGADYYSALSPAKVGRVTKPTRPPVSTAPIPKLDEWTSWQSTPSPVYMVLPLYTEFYSFCFGLNLFLFG
jgi:hypothetical protein